MILLLDSYDSFVHNLARYLVEAGDEVRVIRSDSVDVAEVLEMRPRGVVLSPGPCTPFEAGVGIALVRALGEPSAPSIPLLGVCLGHQVVAQAMGGSLRPARPPRHGVAVLVTPLPALPSSAHSLFSGIDAPFPAGLYHSLAVSPEGLPPELAITAVDDAGEIMALAHRVRPIHGVQFHPESILTPQGRVIIENFRRIVEDVP